MDIRSGSEAREAVRLRGRDAEVAVLAGQLEAVAGGRGGVVIVSGLAGLGKSALLDAAVRAARDRGSMCCAAPVTPPLRWCRLARCSRP